MTKTVYILRSSHDGILGVFTNKKLAYNEALEYVKNTDSDSTMYRSYAQVCKEFKDTIMNSCYVVADHKLELEIEQYPLNNKY